MTLDKWLKRKHPQDVEPEKKPKLESFDQLAKDTMHPSWYEALKNELKKPYMLKLYLFLKQEENEGKTIYPKWSDIFAWARYPKHESKVCIIGQDPYHSGVAMGLSFSVPGTQIPPSLVNMFKELKNDLGDFEYKTGNLSSWAEQGVVLLNTCLTVRKNEALSHRSKGWEQFTDYVIQTLGDVIYVLWGKEAQQKKVKTKIQSSHPSPFSANRGFFGSKPYSKVNLLLKQQNKSEINWFSIK